MFLLKKENWWIWFVLFIFSSPTSFIVLGALLNIYDKKAWYSKLYLWVIGLILIIPFTIMAPTFIIQITCSTAAKLGVKGFDYYLSPYIWIILLIIPIIGWIMFIILYLYLNIAILVNLHSGYGEKYI